MEWFEILALELLYDTMMVEIEGITDFFFLSIICLA